MTKDLCLVFKHNGNLVGEMGVWHMSRFDRPMDYHMGTKIVVVGNVPKLAYRTTVVHFRSELEMSLFALQFGEHRL